MRLRKLGGFVLTVLAIALVATTASADVRLPSVIGDNMILQRDMPLPIWGWAEPGEEVTVKIGGRKGKTTADAKGRWIVRLESMSVGEPLEMTVSGKNTITLSNVLIGEVWLGSGQSNMEWSVAVSDAPKKEIASAEHPKIRLFYVPKRPTGEPADDVDAKWKLCSPDTVGSFSAALYFFGRDLHQKLDVPIGLIQAAWGGTRIEPWTPPVGFEDVPGFNDILKEITKGNSRYAKAISGAIPKFEAWLPRARQALDAGASVPPPPAWPEHPLATQTKPTGLYNGMIHPLIPFAIRGAIWYQGEANWPDGAKYTAMMKALIGGWRKVWGQGDFPFFYVQIAPYDKFYENDALPKLWEAQTAAMTIPNTGMIVTTDIANLDDIHPKNKQDVGRRLSLWALAKTYGHQDLVYSGPMYKTMTVEGDKIRLAFDYAAGGLASSDNKPLSWFEIAGEDRKFVQAQATIDGTTLVVSSDKVKEPVAVRFAWSRVAQPNLMNKEGLPASPFRTDKW